MFNGKCDDILRRADISEEDIIRFILCTARREAYFCAASGLHCIDVPCFSSSIVPLDRHMKYNVVRKIWKTVRRFLGGASEKKITIFDDDLLKVSLCVVIKKGTLYLDKTGRYMIDEYDTRSMSCVQVTNAYKLYSYLEARIEEGNLIRINVIYLLKKLIEAGHVDLVDAILELVLIVYELKRGNFDKLARLYVNLNLVLRKLSCFKDVLKDVLPEPQILEKLKHKIKPLCNILP
ncbi:MAG: hypothetical protein GXO23_00465 [Crenarchaeota archaeon]|nr:hypothetical protein [Thermoproteota archaeon]